MTAPAVALIGDPVAGSISPAMHRAAFAHAGLAWTYEAVTVRAGGVAALFSALRERYAGLNVTRPLKEEVIAFLDQVEPAARRAGSVNTVLFSGSGARGHSTDGPGFLAALRRAGIDGVGRSLVLGTGGAARAVAAALLDEGAEVVVAGRNEAAGIRLAAELGVGWIPLGSLSSRAPMDGAELLVNATPVGGWPDVSETPLPEEEMLPGMAVVDLVYRPRRTALLRRAAAAGCTVVEGIEMLIEQGARSFEIWTGLPAPADVMRAAAYRAVEGEPAATGALR